MPRFKIVVDDPDIAHKMEIERNVKANLDSIVSDLPKEFHVKKIENVIKERFHKRDKGFIHDIADSECPDGLPNCRNCGDPDFLESCKAAGHCPHCGTKHGISPDSVIKKHGYRLEKD